MILPLEQIISVPQSLVASIAEIDPKADFQIESISPFYRTPAYPEGSGPDFVNAVFSASTNLAPEAVLEHLHSLEKIYGRERPYRWAPRTLDLDLLFFGDLVVPNLQVWQEWAGLSIEEAQGRTPDTLILPHPRAHERSFVLGPLNDIAPAFLHPVLQKPISELWQDLPSAERASLTPL